MKLSVFQSNQLTIFSFKCSPALPETAPSRPALVLRWRLARPRQLSSSSFCSLLFRQVGGLTNMYYIHWDMLTSVFRIALTFLISDPYNNPSGATLLEWRYNSLIAWLNLRNISVGKMASRGPQYTSQNCPGPWNLKNHSEIIWRTMPYHACVCGSVMHMHRYCIYRQDCSKFGDRSAAGM